MGTLQRQSGEHHVCENRIVGPWRTARRAALCAAVLLGLGACRGAPEASFSDRLWVSHQPADARANFSAILVTGVRERHVGVLHTGSVYRGQWALFRWHEGEGTRATIEFLQSKKRHRVTLSPCAAPKGFDHCLEMAGDPSGTRRWYSKKRWTLRRKASEELLAGAELVTEIQALIAEAVPEAGASFEIVQSP